MSTGLIALITSPDATVRNRSLDEVCAKLTFSELLAECDNERIREGIASRVDAHRERRDAAAHPPARPPVGRIRTR